MADDTTAKFIIRDIEDRGFAILDLANLESPAENSSWRAFMRTAIDSQLRLWIAIAAVSHLSSPHPIFP
jgi:hypothetical protein